LETSMMADQATAVPITPKSFRTAAEQRFFAVIVRVFAPSPGHAGR
jgi:hypothetical protein